MLGKHAYIVLQRQINATIIHNYYMCYRSTNRKSKVKSCRFQIHSTLLVINIFIYVVFLFSLSAHASSRNVA